MGTRFSSEQLVDLLKSYYRLPSYLCNTSLPNDPVVRLILGHYTYIACNDNGGLYLEVNEFNHIIDEVKLPKEFLDKLK